MRNDSQAVDPVCGMHVDPEATEFHHAYAGEVYHFCTSICRDQFLQHPERFLIDAEDPATSNSEGEAGVRASGRSRAAPARDPARPST